MKTCSVGWIVAILLCAASCQAAEIPAEVLSRIAAIRFALLLGLVLIESLALYTLVIIFAKVV